MSVLSPNRKIQFILGAYFLIGCIITAIILVWVVIGYIFPAKQATDDVPRQAQNVAIEPDRPLPFQSSNLTVHFIDVGQGDSILIQAPDSMIAMIDGGWDNDLALAYLQSHGIDHIDIMIVSHPHADHIGGLIQIMKTMSIGQIWTSGAAHTTSIYEDMLDTLIARQIPYYEVTAGGTIPLGDYTFEVVYGQASADNLNDTSLVLRLDYGQVSFLFTGDAEAYAETTMLARTAQRLDVDILKVGHHGSYTSSSSAFLAAVSPEVAVYSAGRDNDYGHPHDSTIENLLRSRALIYGTDRHGTVVISTNGTTYDIFTEHVASAITGTGNDNEMRLVATPQATFSAELRYDPAGPNRNCGEFRTHEEAQAFFVAAGGPERDPHGLDGDNDGIACENRPREKN